MVYEFWLNKGIIKKKKSPTLPCCSESQQEQLLTKHPLPSSPIFSHPLFSPLLEEPQLFFSLNVLLYPLWGRHPILPQQIWSQPFPTACGAAARPGPLQGQTQLPICGHLLESQAGLPGPMCTQHFYFMGVTWLEWLLVSGAASLLPCEQELSYSSLYFLCLKQTFALKKGRMCGVKASTLSSPIWLSGKGGRGSGPKADGLKIRGSEFQSQLSWGTWGTHLLSPNRLWGKLPITRKVTHRLLYIESGPLKIFG